MTAELRTDKIREEKITERKPTILAERARID
jgi:hypothetical protein